MEETAKIQNRRYIGSKAKLIPWIFEIIHHETKNVKTFCDMFAGTGVIANEALNQYEKVIVNDILYSNNTIYQAFWGGGKANRKKLIQMVDEFNSIDSSKLGKDYFSSNFGGKYFEERESKKIGLIRENIEKRKGADIKGIQYSFGDPYLWNG